MLNMLGGNGQPRPWAVVRLEGKLVHLRGVPIAVIAAWLGHASAAFATAVYAHSQDDASGPLELVSCEV